MILNPLLRVVQRTEQALLSLEKALRLVPELRTPAPKREHGLPAPGSVEALYPDLFKDGVQ